MLELRNLEIFMDDFELRANWQLKKGGIYAMIGPSGVGKSTLLSIIGGFLKPSSGQLIFDGLDLTKQSPSDRPIAHIFQSHNLFPKLTVEKNIALGQKDQNPIEMQELAKAMGIFEILHRFPHQISGGQAARATLARAILQHQKLWLFDEPFAALGPKLDRELRAMIAQDIHTHPDRTLIFVSHQAEQVFEWADFIIWVSNGVAHAPVRTVRFREYPPEAAKNYL